MRTTNQADHGIFLSCTDEQGVEFHLLGICKDCDDQSISECTDECIEDFVLRMRKILYKGRN